MRLRRPVPAVLLAVALGLATSACGGDDDGRVAPNLTVTPTGSPSPTAASQTSAPATAAAGSLPVPDGVTLTAQGSALTVGTTATVAWQPRQDVVGVLDITIDRLEQTTLAASFDGWKIPPESATATPYFVRATVTNRGATDLSGGAVPLYIVDAGNALIEATTFASNYTPCPGGVFPAAFGPTATAQVCLVFFAANGGTLSAVSFRPTQEFNPITWTGEVVPAEVKKKNKKKPSASPAAG